MGSAAAQNIVIRESLQRDQWQLPHKLAFWLCPYFKGGEKEGLKVCAAIWPGLDGKPGGITPVFLGPGDSSGIPDSEFLVLEDSVG